MQDKTLMPDRQEVHTEWKRLPNRFLKWAGERMSQRSVRSQIRYVILCFFVLPVSVFSALAILYFYRYELRYNEDLLESDNSRVTATLYELTTQVYGVSNGIVYDRDLWDALTAEGSKERDTASQVQDVQLVRRYAANAAVVESIRIYTDNPYLQENQIYRRADDKVRHTEWYRSAMMQQSPLWTALTDPENADEDPQICLVRRIPLQNATYSAVLVIGLDNSFLKTRFASPEYGMALSIDRGTICFASDSGWEQAAMETLVPVEYSSPYYRYTGIPQGSRRMVTVTELSPYRSESSFYVASYNDRLYAKIRDVLLPLILICAVAILIPSVLAWVYTTLFTRRVSTVRAGMHRVSEGDYNSLAEISGGDELSEISRDLGHVVRHVREADREVYESRIREKELENNQESMRYALLASQINPHFLYNTLESIRMKALAEGSRSTAQAIQKLGRTMRYVLGSSVSKGEVPLSGELDFIRDYMSIMRFRFGERLSFTEEISEGIRAEETRIMPLLLQPVVENAVLHGIDEKEEGGTVTLSVCRNEDFLEIVVKDDGVGMDPAELETVRKKLTAPETAPRGEAGAAGRHGFALRNIAERIRLHYGLPYGIRIDSAAAEGTAVTFRLPVLSDSTDFVGKKVGF